MNRRIILIAVAGVLFALLLIFLWLWFFTGDTPLPQGNGSFGSGSERPVATSSTTPSNIPGQVVPETTVNEGTVVTGTGNYIDPGVAYVPGVQWLGEGGGLGGGTITNFVPSGINELNTGQVGGTVTVLGSGPSTQTQQGLGLETALIGAGVAGAVACSASVFGGTGGGALTSAAIAPIAVTVNAPVQNIKDSNDLLRDNFLNCIARTIARAAIQQITASTVNWINSGFQGKPTFVQDYQKFFTNVLDQAAGEFLRGSDLAFLCTPFRNQIRIALAQSYARRNAAPSCTLSGVVNNFTSFTNGNFSSGGWKGLLTFVNTPSNNPFGAFATAQSGLFGAQSTALSTANRQLTPTGFLAQQEKYDCQAVVGATGPEQRCKTRITTPGGVIESSLNKALGTSIDSLNLAKNFDEIISALVTQLMTKALYGGLSNLSGVQGYESSYLTPDQQQAQEQGQSLLENLQIVVRYAQQYGAVYQGMIRDAQGTQEQLTNAANCWSVAASSTTSVPKQTQATNNNAAALAAAQSYEPRIATYNTNITRANAAIAFIQDLQTRTLGVTSTADVRAIANAYNTEVTNGNILLEADVTQAQQDRTALQNELAARNQQTSAELQQCYAF